MTAYLNGTFMPLAEAKVPAMDRGFLFGDGAYEVIPVYARRPFRLDGHLERLQRTLDGIRLANPHDVAEWTRLIGELIARNTTLGDELSVYLQVTRGAEMRRNFAFPAQAPPTVFMFCEPLVTPSPAQCAQGVAAITAPDIRWLRCNLKTVSLIANCLLRQQAIDAGCAETVMLRDGYLSEGSASNIFVVRAGVLCAPPKTHLILPGVTYDVVLELAAAAALPIDIRPIAETEVREADELWLTSSAKEVLAIVTLDGRPVGRGAAAGRPGPWFERIHADYQAFKRKVMRGEG